MKKINSIATQISAISLFYTVRVMLKSHIIQYIPNNHKNTHTHTHCHPLIYRQISLPYSMGNPCKMSIKYPLSCPLPWLGFHLLWRLLRTAGGLCGATGCQNLFRLGQTCKDSHEACPLFM